MPAEFFLRYIWLIPLFPLAGAATMLFIGRKLSNSAVSAVGVGSVGLSVIFAFGAILQLIARAPAQRVVEIVLFDWVPAGAMHLTSGRLINFSAQWGMLLDPLSAIMIGVVTGVGFLIHVYSTGYMAHEGGYYRFFGYLNLFMFSMLVLVLGNNLLLLFVGWEGVGLCSYLLIGFYFLRKSASDAGKKAFVVNRIGDTGFVLGLFLLLNTIGTLRFTEVGPAIEAGGFAVGSGVMTAIALLLFVGATGKSAQIPLYVWLPDAMEGPTPVSALIHAATMVTAGVYMITRMNVVFQLAPIALGAVATIGAVTAIYAASMGLVQNDIKRVLAYSTVSQLGYMFLALGVGAFTAGIFHLMTHAFFKALLFLGSGSVIHAMGGEQDMRKMGALWGKIPKTAWTFMIATIAISGIPPLAGFVSKDAILAASFNARPLLWGIGFVTAGMTAFYMFRLVFMTFFGKSRVEHDVEHHIHESPGSMTVPLMILAFFSIVGGWIGWPESLGGSDHFAHFLDPVIARHAEVVAAVPEAASHAGEYALMGISVLVALIGITLAWFFYLRRPSIPGTLAEKWGGLYRLIYNKYYIDQIYDAMFVNRAKDLGTTLGAFDRGVIDGLGVNGAGWVTRTTSSISMVWDKWVIDGLVNLAARIVWIFSYPVRWVQSGRVSNYALLIVLGVLIFLGYYLRLNGVTLRTVLH
ncbi:MAG TPA: NADH-quinone oxidoreductase subunit L [Candidatus Acidoferrales bacterium]|jgi:NADH-quinone oxidoreductase subunit L|nr:NADH-quinone oxidoreductase subunit L [Candidatus Acidoferrales bacterium]